jgi:hypothetical protein
MKIVDQASITVDNGRYIRLENSHYIVLDIIIDLEHPRINEWNWLRRTTYAPQSLNRGILICYVLDNYSWAKP